MSDSKPELGCTIRNTVTGHVVKFEQILFVHGQTYWGGHLAPGGLIHHSNAMFLAPYNQWTLHAGKIHASKE